MIKTREIFHQLTVEDALKAMESDPHGLTWEDVEERWARFGQNILRSEERVDHFRIFFNQVLNPLVLILILAAGISILARHFIDAVVIGIIIVINTLIGYFQESKAEEAIEALKNRAAPQATVVRVNPRENESVEQIVDARDIVPGDIILLETGDRIPADARIMSAINLELDESMLTGESTPVKKTDEVMEESAGLGDRLNILYAGAVVTHGRGKAMVFATGADTEIGRIAEMIQETEKVESPLKKKADRLGRNLAIFAVFFSAVVFIVEYFTLGSANLEDVLLFSLASAISSIPEGLPAVMTITLAVGVNRMAQRNAIIRKLRAVDTLGAATVICTDKTGTLTTNQMTVREVFSNHKTVQVSGIGFEPDGGFEVAGKDIKVEIESPLYWTIIGGALCNNSRLVYDENRYGSPWFIKGDPTEGALISTAAKAGFPKEKLESEFPRVDEIPFDSKQKFMATFHTSPDGGHLIFIKGAPEKVLDFCSYEISDAGKEKLTAERRDELVSKSTMMAEKALRVLAVAYCDGLSVQMDKVKDNIYQEKRFLTFSGLVGMIDPPREEARQAIEKCKQAGIGIIMATGDHPVTAKAIARELNMLPENELIITGADIEKMTDDQLDQASQDATVFARVSPEHKYRLVESLKRLGHIVSMTGDGVNDAPALKNAQVGVSMGIAGTDVAREASDMVLTDDNFTSIVNAVEEGRVVFQNIRKVVKFLISTNFGEDIAILISIILFRGLPLIFTPVQILWVNLVTDGVLDVAIAMEPKERNVMDEPPRKIDAPIINREILLNTLFIASVMAVGTLLIFEYGYQSMGINYARTMAFATLALFQVFNSFNVRSRSQSVLTLGVFKNKYLNIAVIASTALLAGTIYLPFLQKLMETTPLGINDWLIIVPVSSTILVFDEMRKFIYRKYSSQK